MGIWKEIRKTLNSTLGTQDFKPLDYIIRYDSKSLVASNNVLADIPIKVSSLSHTSYPVALSDITNIGSFISKVGGTITVYSYVTISSASTQNYAKAELYVYVNGVIVSTVTITNNGSTDSLHTLSHPTSQNITVNANDVVEFKVRLGHSGNVSNTATLSINTLQARADVKDNLITSL